jgi:hypothetical protein
LGWDGTSKYQRECFFWLGWFLPGPVVRLVEANTRDKNTSEWAGITVFPVIILPLVGLVEANTR